MSMLLAVMLVGLAHLSSLPPVHASDHQGAQLVYDRLGVTFITGMTGDHVDSAVIYPPSSEGEHRERTIGARELLPGIGAYGIRIGDGTHAFDSLTGVKSCRSVPDTTGPVPGTIVGCEFADGRRLQASLVDGHVANLAIFGAFVTPEGLTEQASSAEIRRVYGPPDSEVRIGHHPPAPILGMAVPISLLILGCVAGFVIRKARTSASQGFAAMWFAVGVGALCSAAATCGGMYAAARGGNEVLTGTSVLFSAMGLIAGVYGGVSAAVLELLCRRFRSGLSPAVVLIAMLATGFVGGLLASLALPGKGINPQNYLPIGLMLGLYDLGLLLLGRR